MFKVLCKYGFNATFFNNNNFAICMTKKLIVGGISIIVIIGIIIVTYTSSTNDTLFANSVDISRASNPLGNPNAPITIIEFGDYQCEACAHWYHTTRDSIISNYVETGKANIIFVDLAFLGSDSSKAAHATYCAEDQGKYWEYHSMLYERQKGIDDGWANKISLQKIAEEMGLDGKIFEDCIYSDKHLDRVEFNSKQAKKQGIRATPGFIIISDEGMERISGAQPYHVFNRVLDTLM